MSLLQPTKKKYKMGGLSVKKRIISLVLVAVMLLLATCTTSCSTGAPELDDVRDRIVYLIESSKEVNVIFFGKGLPIYEKESLLAEKKGIYYNDEYVTYNRVMENTDYITAKEIKERAEKVYSTEYLKGLYETSFQGVMTGSTSAYIRFFESTDWIYQNIDATDYDLSERIYDYSSMEMVLPSNNKYINITIDTYTLANRKVKTIQLTFVYERGNWYLDSPTY